MKIHFVGIGGIGMSGLAKILAIRGDTVSGCDRRASSFLGALVGHDPTHLQGVELVVCTAAIREDHPEIAKAKSLGIPVLKYAEMLGQLTLEKSTIAIAGCHGKTTTTSMIAWILSRAGFGPSYVCGGVIPQLESSNAASGLGKHFVVEACEYDRSFLNLSPACAVITNIEEDHLDYYKDITEINAAFHAFAAKSSGPIIASADNVYTAALMADFKEKGESFSILKDADWRARSIEVKDGRWAFEVLRYGRPYGQYTLSVAGEHNVSNALAALAAVIWAGVGQEIVQLALSEFTGVDRRFQLLGEKKGALVIDDYGHHPTEIQATLKAVKERYPDRKIWCVFQPHQNSRTRIFMKAFARAFSDAHVVLLPEIYEARDSMNENCKKVSSADLAKALADNGKTAIFLPSFEEVLTLLNDNVTPDVLVLTMGAGDVNDIARRLLDN